MSSVQSTQFGTNLPPVSFPGVSSGIDYNSIIQKISALSAAPIQTYQKQIQAATAQNTELIKINGLLVSVQNAIGTLSNPSLFQAVTVVSSNAAAATGTAIAGQTPLAGSYTIDSVTLGTQTTIVTNDAGDGVGYGTAANPAKLLNDPTNFNAIAATTTDPSGTAAYVTLNGQKISYSLNGSSIGTIVATINASPALYKATASFNAGTGIFTITSTTATPLQLGSANDTGNLWKVLKVDQAVPAGVPPGSTYSSVAAVGGVSLTTSYNAPGNAGFNTPVTVGQFTINGTAIKVLSGQNLNDTIIAINSSGAGVVASFNTETGRLTLANKNPGNQGIVLGAGTDTSNFLTAVGLTVAGPQTVVTTGTQSKVTYTTPTGAIATQYSNTNAVQGIIPGITLNLLSNTATPFTVNVAADATQAQTAIQTFVGAYNAAIDEINQATAAPVIGQAPGTQSTTQTSSQLVGGGILFGNSDIVGVKDRLVNLATGILSSNYGTSYNSLSSIGLQLDDSFQILSANTGSQQQAGSQNANQAVTAQTIQGTSGRFKALDTAKFAAAFAANASAVAAIFTTAGGITTSLGEYLTSATGQPTNFAPGLVGLLGTGNNIPATSFFQNFENANSDVIKSLNQQVQQITDSVNQQANALRAQFVSAEAQIGQLQSLQSQLGLLITSFSGH